VTLSLAKKRATNSSASQGAFSLWCRKGKAFCEHALALYRQQHGKDKQEIEFAHPGKVFADASASDLNFLKFLAFCRHVLVVSYLQTVAARGEVGREGCEISSLVEHMGLSPWLFLLVAFPVTPAVLILSNS